MDWKTIVGTVAPWIGTALGGPLGGAAVGAIADALGLSDKTEASIKAALSGVTPEQMLAIKNADQAFAVKMQELGYDSIKDMEALAVQDRDSARKREMEVKDNANKIIAGCVLVIWAVINILVILNDVPTGSEQLVARLLGTMDAALMCVLYYYFGGSRGSDRKTELLAQKQ
jgi:hypothetical protein